VKPVAIFRHSPSEGPGYFATCLDRSQVPWQLIRVDAGDALPGNVAQFSGLVFMGGPMSVNDDLPWIAPVLELIRSAVAKDVPVLGHCLGGQLVSKALGGAVTRAPLKEIGWGEVEIAGDESAKMWFGAQRGRFVTFHWHGETFTVPRGASRVLSSPYCENQGFALGPHLALQCHLEMTRDLVESWCRTGHREIEKSQSPAVQPVMQILDGLEGKLKALHAVADTVYARWMQRLVN